ncbi:hypothetical protein E1176_02555 [Fulvivirga sp. RKSG066]|uniref:hypothetical protein n=1 Tax=Fulvivirga aurantia TaxID=2529383 RepID=UPI0012BB5C13|nr:hypothetical protein [Fulvivirga aurantia]MTI19892.1 hypothetical protein [Fulvivirga aurantia]
MKTITLLLVLAISFSSSAQSIAPEKARQDLQQLKEAIETYNPALLLYNPDFVAKAEAVIEKVNGEISLIKHFQNVSEICVLSNEGHFAIGKWSDEVHEGFLNNTYRYLPLSINIIDNDLIVRIDNSMEKQLEQGDKILSINRTESSQILESLYRHIPADGEILTYKNRNIELGFSWMYYLYIDQPEEFELEVEKSNGERHLVKIEALERDTQFDNYAK